MIKDIVVPALGESVSEATIAKWYKNVGDSVKTDELILELETDKVTLEVNAQSDGVISEISQNEGDTVSINQVIGKIDSDGVASNKGNSNSSDKSESSNENKNLDLVSNKDVGSENNKQIANEVLAPSVRKIVAENNLNVSDITGTGKDGRITKGDALDAIQNKNNVTNNNSQQQQVAQQTGLGAEKRVERVRMSRLRQTIASRLKESQNTAAILSTFNEIDMSKVIALRKKHKEAFEKKHGVKLGFMSFFVKAVVSALQEIPSVNAEIQGNEILYKYHYDIGVAVGTEQGLVVPVLRDADKLSFANVESSIVDLAKKARSGKLSMSDLSGGTFSITNGGVYGSLLSTPIINPPQTGIIGLHNTQERPVVVNGEIVIRPMMYVALSYDHRIIDGKDAVLFLVKVKNLIEDPDRLLIDL